MISLVASAVQTNIESLNEAARRVSRPENGDLARDIPDLIVAEHALEASIVALRELSRTEGHIVDLLA